MFGTNSKRYKYMCSGSLTIVKFTKCNVGMGIVKRKWRLDCGIRTSEYTVRHNGLRNSDCGGTDCGGSSADFSIC